MKKIDFNFNVVATVSNVRVEIEDDYWESIQSEITLEKDVSSKVFTNIDKFSHLEILFFFHKTDEIDIIDSCHPRGDPKYPEMGIFAQRKKENS